MNADLEAAIAEGRRRMKQFEEKTAHQIDMFDREVDNNHHKLGHKYSSVTEDLKPVSWPLWGVVLETSNGNQIYKEHVPFDLVAKCPRHCACTSSLSLPNDRPLEVGSSIPSIEAKAIIEGRRWGVNKYLYDEEYVSNPPYGTFMKKPTPRPSEESTGSSSLAEQQPNTKLVSQYWRRKWKIPNDW